MQDKISEHSLGIKTLFAIIFLEGFVSISVEVLTIRQLIPVVGNSVIVTSLIIGIFLLFLALGYYRGGYYRQNYLAVLQRNFCIAAVMLGFGLSYLFILNGFTYFDEYISSNSLIALLVYLLGITAPLIFILGQTVPITTNLFRFEHHVGAISGKVLYLSTLGSFLGAVATAAVLMNFFGVAWTVVINFIAMLSLVVLLQSVTKEKWLATLVVAFCGGLIYWVNVGFEKSAFITTNQYNNYALIKDYIVDDMGPGNILSVNNSASSYLNDKKQGFPYAEFIKNVLFKQLKLQNKEILVIGAGGFSLSAESDFGNHFIYNDIDKQIKPAAKQGFIDRINGDFVAEDARSFLMNKVDQFDVIINDAFSNRYAIPFYLLTQEHIQNIRHALRDNGLAIFNIIANPFFQSRYSRRVDNTIRSVFPSCSATPLRFNTKVTSIIYICQKSSYDADNTIYTDNRNTTTLDFYTQ